MSKNLDRFISDREPTWEALDSLVQHAKRRPDRLPPPDVLTLGTAYRTACADLSYARRRFASNPVVPRLEKLVSDARSLVYAAPEQQEDFISFVATGYWQRIWRSRKFAAWASVLLFGPAFMAAAYGYINPTDALSAAPAPFRGVVSPRGPTQGSLEIGQRAAFAGQIYTNNIRVTFLSFAAGIFTVIGPAFVLVNNGLSLGLLGGLAYQSGNGSIFTELVVAHGVLELSCIVIGGAAGLELGWALVAPGRRKRTDALMKTGRHSVEIVLGTAPWLVIAGLVEGFITPGGYGLTFNSILGVSLGLVYWTLVVWRGRTPQTLTRDLVLR